MFQRLYPGSTRSRESCASKALRRACLLAAALGLAALEARSAPKPGEPRKACAESQRRSRESEAAGRLREARNRALGCSEVVCGFIGEQCRAAYDRLRESIPSVVPVVVGEHGEALVDVEMSMDGTTLTNHVDGRAVAVDPGIHQFRFSARDRAPVAATIMVAQGQRNRPIAVTLTRSRPEDTAATNAQDEAPGEASLAVRAPGSPASGVLAAEGDGGSIWPYAVGGAGLASVGASVAFVAWGQQDSQLLDRCGPNCKLPIALHVKKLHRAADITFGAGVAALGVATWLYFISPGRSKPSAERPITLDLKPTRSGALATLGGAF
jgi:hypothetical protein